MSSRRNFAARSLANSLRFLLLCAVLMPAAYAQATPAKSPFDGVWTIATPGGPRPLEATFEVNGDKVGGTMKLGPGAVVAISGKIDGRKISFQFPGQNKRTLYFSGTLDGDVIELELSLGPGEYGSPFTAKRK